MSLLMDALRKAEQQKQKLAGQTGLSLEPIPGAIESAGSASSTASGLPELPGRLDALDEQFMAHAGLDNLSRPMREAIPHTAAATPSTPVTPREPAIQANAQKPHEAPRATARAVFEAKSSPATGNRHFALAAGLLSLIGAAGIGGYFWWQLQPRNTAVIATSPPPQPTPAVQLPAQVPAAVSPAPTFTPQTPIDLVNEAPESQPKPIRQSAPTKPVQAPSASAAVPTPRSPIQRSISPPRPDTTLIQAHDAFNRGESDLAQTIWLKVLAADPRNSDALHGLAVTAQQRHQTAEAAGYYQRALDIDPKDGLALAGLLALKPSGNPLQAESHLKTLLAEQPESAYLQFALGNQLARQQRWPEAQQAYFKAYSIDPGNPGYAFNLAISLDQLHQTRLAIQYYQEALAVADKQPGQAPGFNRNDVSVRLKQLQGESDAPR